MAKKEFSDKIYEQNKIKHQWASKTLDIEKSETNKSNFKDRGRQININLPQITIPYTVKKNRSIST